MDPIISIRTTSSLVARLDRIVQRLRAQVSVGRVSRSDVARTALDIGLRSLERKGATAARR